MAFWVYILRCADESYYTGHTDCLEKRIAEHTSGAIASCYTFKRRPLELVFSQEFPTREEALAAERQIKGWSRKKKEAMMRGDWSEVSRLARSSTAPVCPKPEVRQAHQDRKAAPVRPEPEVRQGRQDRIPAPVRPEPVEGRQPPSVHPSTSSGRTEDEVPR